MSEQKPTYLLSLNPDKKDSSNEDFLKGMAQEDLKNYEFAANLIGKAKGWQGNPRWDLIIEKGLEAFVKESK